MKSYLTSILTFLIFSMSNYVTVPKIMAESVKPTWELTSETLGSAPSTGKVEFTEGSVILDGTNSFSVPAMVLGAQNDYTIEFELKRPSGATQGRDDLVIFSNMSREKNAGMEFKYCAPPYNAALLFINGFKTVEYRNFLSEKFDKVTLVAKDKKLTLFRNGLVLAMTDVVHPSDSPIVFGGTSKEKTTPYTLRNVRIYDTALFPTGSEQQIGGMMRFCSGDQYTMLRVEIEDPALPRILVIGDSISMGYREFITRHFKGRAYVDYWTGGGWIDPNAVRGANSAMKRAWNGILSNGPYDVITWNAMTLHMWNPDMPERSPDDTYVANMTEVVEHIRATAPETKFIWVRCTPFTTPVEGGPSVVNMEKSRRLIKRNAETDEIMRAHGIPEVDLYDLAEKNLDKASKDGVHWEQSASRLMAEEIIKEIEKVLPEKNQPRFP